MATPGELFSDGILSCLDHEDSEKELDAASQQYESSNAPPTTTTDNSVRVRPLRDPPPPQPQRFLHALLHWKRVKRYKKRYSEDPANGAYTKTRTQQLHIRLLRHSTAIPRLLQRVYSELLCRLIRVASPTLHSLMSCAHVYYSLCEFPPIDSVVRGSGIYWKYIAHLDQWNCAISNHRDLSKRVFCSFLLSSS